MELNTGRNMHQQNSVLMTFRICTWQILTLNPYRRIAEIERNSKQLIDPFLVSVNALNPSGLVRHSNSKHTAISISHCHNRYSQCLWFYLYALAIECLTFLASRDFFYCHILWVIRFTEYFRLFLPE